jgi:hypothetical protein
MFVENYWAGKGRDDNKFRNVFGNIENPWKTRPGYEIP